MLAQNTTAGVEVETGLRKEVGASVSDFLLLIFPFHFLATRQPGAALNPSSISEALTPALPGAVWLVKLDGK